MFKRFFPVFLVSVIMMTACTGGKTQTLEAFWKEAGIETVDNVSIQSGTTGVYKTLADEAQIDRFLKSIKDTVFAPQKDQSARGGWSYRIILHDGDKTFEFFLNKIGRVYYDSNPDIRPVVEEFYQRAEAAEGP